MIKIVTLSLFLFSCKGSKAPDSTPRRTPAPKGVTAQKKQPPKYVRKGFHTCSEKDAASHTAPRPGSAIAEATDAQRSFLRLLFLKGQKLMGRGDEAIWQMLQRTGDLVGAMHYASVRASQFNDYYGAVRLVDWALCTMPGATGAWIAKLKYEGHVIHNKGLPILNMGPNVLAVGHVPNQRRLKQLYGKLPASYAKMTPWLLSRFPKNRAVLSALAENLGALGLTSWLDKVHAQLDSVAPPTIRQQVARASYYMKHGMVKKARAQVARMGAHGKMLGGYHILLAGLATKAGDAKLAALHEAQGQFYGDAIPGYEIPWSSPRQRILGLLKGSISDVSKGLSAVKSLPPKERAALLAAATSVRHNCDRDPHEAAQSRRILKALFAMGPSWHGALEAILKKGVKCQGMRTVVAELMVQRLQLVKDMGVVTKLLAMEYDADIFEKTFINQSLVEAGHTSYLPAMLNKLFKGELELRVALTVLRVTARFQGAHARGLLDAYRGLHKARSGPLLNAAAALCTYGVTGDTKLLSHVVTALSTNTDTVPYPYLCFVKPGSALAKPIQALRKHANKSVRSFAVAYLKAIRQSPTLFITHKAYVNTKGMTHLLTACRKGDRRACASMVNGFVYSPGERSAAAQKYWHRVNKVACEHGYKEGCLALGVIYGTGTGVTKDSARSAKYYTKACDGGVHLGCANLAWMYLAGEGVAKDLTRGVAMAKRACAKGVAVGCAYAAQGTMWMGSKEVSGVISYLTKGCRLKNAKVCFSLAKFIAQYGEGKDRINQVMEALLRACSYGHHEACNMAMGAIDIRQKIKKTKSSM